MNHSTTSSTNGIFQDGTMNAFAKAFLAGIPFSRAAGMQAEHDKCRAELQCPIGQDIDEEPKQKKARHERSLVLFMEGFEPLVQAELAETVHDHAGHHTLF